MIYTESGSATDALDATAISEPEDVVEDAMAESDLLQEDCNTVPVITRQPIAIAGILVFMMFFLK
jgi:hypothetical protein